MGVSNIFEIVQILPNRAKHHICELERCASLTDLFKASPFLVYDRSVAGFI